MILLRYLISLLGLCSILLCSPFAQAQKGPQLGYMYPPVLKAGQANQVQLGGYDFTPDLHWFFYHPGVTVCEASSPGEYQITPPPYWTGPRMSVASPMIAREVKAIVQVSPDSPTGLGYFQVANANGISQTSAYLVREGEEVEELRWRDDVQYLTSIPIGVSGRLRRLTEVDRYRFQAVKDGLVHIVLHARRLGSNFNAMLKVENAQGECLVDVADTLGTDCHVVFPVRNESEYTISIHDADFRGDASFVYHLSIDDRPVIERCFPDTLTPGVRNEVECYGWGIVSGARKLESTRIFIDVPADYIGNEWQESIATAFGTVALKVPVGQRNVPRVELAVGEKVTGAFALSNHFRPAVKEHRYGWKALGGIEWQIDLQSILFGSNLDLELQLLDASGKLVASSEDVVGSTDPMLKYRTDTDTELTLVIKRLLTCEEEELNRYFLYVRPVEIGFRLTMEQALPVALGGKREWIIKAERQGGHDAEIVLEVSGLPEGVTLQGEKKIDSGKNEVKWILDVASTSKVVAAPLRVAGEAMIEGEKQRREAVAKVGRGLAPLKLSQMQVQEALLAMTMEPPFEILLLDKTRQRDTPRGATCVVEMDIVRKPGYEGEILVEMAAQQSRYLCGSYGLNARAAPGVKRIEYGAWMSEWLGTEYTMRMATHGVAQVADPQGNMRYLVKGTDAPVTMIMEGALLKVSTESSIVPAKLGESVVLPVRISRSPKLVGAVTVQLDWPSELRDLCQASTISLSETEIAGELTLDIPNDPRLTGQWRISVRANGQTGQWPVQAFGEIELRVGSQRL